MESFEYTVTAEHGLHARPAGLLVNHARTLSCRVQVKCGEKQADATRIIALMGLGAVRGDTLTFVLTGEDEKGCAASLAAFCREHL